MKTFIAILVGSLLLNITSDDWKPGKTDKNGDLIIVELDFSPMMTDRPKHQVVTVDMPWSILIRYDEDTDPAYYIFNNKAKKVFSTASFSIFINELNKLPDNITVRKIGRCTIPFDYMIPDKEKEQIEELFKKKNCILEERIMYCWCGAVKMVYPFEK